MSASIDDRRTRLAHVVSWVAAGSGMFGVISGFAVFLLWNDQISQHPALFLVGLAVAAATAFVTETLRDLVRTGEPETPTPRRILTSFVTLASLETFIIAWHSIVDLFEETHDDHANGALAGAGYTVVDVVGKIVGMAHPSALLQQFGILVGIWVLTGATAGFFFCRLVFMRAQYRPGEGIVRAVWAAAASAALVMLYVVLIRMVLSVRMLFTQPAVVANGYGRLLADMIYQVTRPMVDAISSWWLAITAFFGADWLRAAWTGATHGDLHAIGPLALAAFAAVFFIGLAIVYARVFLPLVLIAGVVAVIIALGLATIFGFASLAAANAVLAVIVALLIGALVVAAAVFAVLRVDLSDPDEASRVFVPIAFVVGLPAIGFIVLLVAPLLVDWFDLLTLPLMVFVVWVLPLIVLAVAIPYLRRPSRNTRAWAAIAGVAALLIAIITFIAVGGTMRWVGLVATLAVAAGGYALSKQEDATDVWPIAAISLAVISCAGTLVLSNVTASFRGVFTRVAEITMLPQDFQLPGVDIDRGARLVVALQTQEPTPAPAPFVPVQIPVMPLPVRTPLVFKEHIVVRYPLGCASMPLLIGSHRYEVPSPDCKPLPVRPAMPQRAPVAQPLVPPAPLATMNPRIERLLAGTPAAIDPAVAIPHERDVLERRLACIVNARATGTLDALYAPLLARPWWSADAAGVRFGGATAALVPSCTSAGDAAIPAIGDVDAIIVHEQTGTRETVPQTDAVRAYAADLGRMRAAFDQLDRYQRALEPAVVTPVTAGDAPTPDDSLPPDEVARILEVCLAGSTAFWLAVAFLATWQMRAVFEREQAEHAATLLPAPAPAD